ncbi:ParB/RepB/Spo0J family partition protein [Chryseobacterium sp. CT-SW4]|uniref:ParB/RepB/Spo0J family partition protein n=1 Tax=Chryseobacterium sp. SW-1 TaxID=3157343 RepID=UPI003B024805
MNTTKQANDTIIFKDLKINELIASSSNPRTDFEETALNELAESIKAHGVLQPIIVRTHPNIKKKYEIVCGERRYRASCIAGVKTIPASIRELNDDEVFEIQIIENLERKDVHPMDEAKAFKKMIDSGKYTLEDISAKIAKNQTFVAQRLKLNDLIDELQEEFLKGEFGVGHAVLYSRLTSEKQSDIFNDAKTGWNQGYGTLKEAKAELERENVDLDNAIFDLSSEDLLPTAGACSKCLKCSSANTVLFPEFEGNFCFDFKCFQIKSETEKANRLIKVLEENPNVILVASWNFKSNKLDDIINEYGKKLLKQYDDYSTYGKEGEGVQAWHVDDAVFIEIFLKENTKTDTIINNPGANQTLLLEISKIKDRANRALELDREKIYKRTIEELVYNDEKNSLLITGEDLIISEKIAICHSLLTYGDDDWISEEFGVDRFVFRNDRIKIITENFTDQFLFKVLRRHIKSDLVSLSNLDYEKNDDPKAYFSVIKDYFPDDIKIYTDEQNDLASKRIERSNKRINDLEDEVKRTLESIETQKDELQTNNVCTVCNRSDADFIDEFGHPAIWKDNVCLPCSSKSK